MIVVGLFTILFIGSQFAEGLDCILKQGARFLEEESKDLASSVLSASLFVVHDTVGSGQDELTELTRREQIRSELLDLSNLDVESRGDHTALVQTSQEVDNNLAAPVVINDLEVTNVAVLLHDLKKLDDHLRTGSNEDL